MSKLVEAASEFLSRDTSTKQTRNAIVESTYTYSDKKAPKGAEIASGMGDLNHSAISSHMKASGIPADHVKAISAHLKTSKHQDSPKLKDGVMSKHGDLTVHSFSDPDTGKTKFHVETSKLVEAAAEFLSRDTSTKQTRNILESSEDPKITDKVIKKTGDSDISHVGSTKEGHHVYAHSETDRGEASTYVVHHPDGKMTSHHVDHGGELPSARELSKPASFHNVHDLHPSVRKLIHKDMRDEGVGERYDD